MPPVFEKAMSASEMRYIREGKRIKK